MGEVENIFLYQIMMETFRLFTKVFSYVLISYFTIFICCYLIILRVYGIYNYKKSVYEIFIYISVECKPIVIEHDGIHFHTSRVSVKLWCH